MSKPEFVYITYIETTPEKAVASADLERFHQTLLVGTRRWFRIGK